MAFGAGVTLGATANKDSGTSIVHTVTDDAAVGDLVVVRVTKDGIGSADGESNEVTSVTDSAGNTYTRGREEAFNGTSGVITALFYSRITAALTSGSSTITASWASARDAKAISCWKHTVGADVQQAATAVGGGWTSLVDLGPLSFSGLPSKEYLFLRGDGQEAPVSTSTYTVTTGYTAATRLGTTGGGAASNVQVMGEFRILTGTGDTSDPTLSADSQDKCSVFIVLEEVVGGVTGTIASQAAVATAAVAVDVGVTGTAAGQAPAATGALATNVAVTGVVAGQAPAAQGAIDSSVEVSAQVTSQPAAAQSTSAGVLLVEGSIVSTASVPTSEVQGTVGAGVTGTIASPAPAAQGAVVGSVDVQGTITAQAPAPASAVEGGIAVTAIVAAVAPVPDSAVAAVVLVRISLSAQAPAAAAEVQGSVLGEVSGTITAVAAAAAAQVDGKVAMAVPFVTAPPLPGLFIHEVVVYNRIDHPDENPFDLPALFDAGRTVDARVYSKQAEEDVSGVRVTTWGVVLPPDVQINALSEIEYAGMRMRVSGEPSKRRSSAGPHHIELEAQEVSV